MKSEEKFYIQVATAFCLIVLFISMFVLIGYGIGVSTIKPRTIELAQSYHSGAIPANVPVWAVYEDGGRLSAYSAIATDTGMIHDFAINGEPVPFDPLPEPMAWTELDAGILEVLK